ncbi:MAG: bifunctional rhamnulose-1-phosphate aldolase/short-chain dehydrogenase [Fimbriimonadaceae bacterium]
MIPNLWNAPALSAVDLLIYRSNLLGSDPRITNFGGGNTSAKVDEVDPLSGETVTVMWVKGSGGDLGTMKRAGLASLYLEPVLGLESRYQAGTTEDEIVGLYQHCNFGLNPTACSIDTPLHAFVPFKHVDHVHADAVIAIAASANAEALTKEIYGDEVGYVPWKRPGFELGLMIRDQILQRPGIKGIVMGSHGLINWADDAKECYELTLRLINQAQSFIDSRSTSSPFGEQMMFPQSGDLVETTAILRGLTTFNNLSNIAHMETSEAVLDFVSRSRLSELAQMGTSCPDHFLRTKIRPMILEMGQPIEPALEEYRKGYSEYYERCKHSNSPAIRNPNPSVILVPGRGMITFGKTKKEAMVTSEFYCRAIEVMRGAETVSKYTALPEQEAFDIEYWLLEEAKLQRMPAEKEFSRKIALVTGGGQGIGLATAKQLHSKGACVVVLDLNEEKIAEINAPGLVDFVGIKCDVTDSQALREAFRSTVEQFGGLDICVINAGNARRGTVADTTDADYKFLSDLLMKAYFEAMREATQLMIKQGLGGNLVVVGSKNAATVGSNAAIYSATKAFELHLMRSAANDLAKHGIRCNAVNPDAVIQGSGIWSDAWKTQTAASLGIAIEQLPDYYRKRSLLGVEVHPEHVAEAICWLASDAKSSRTTGAVIPVDAGVREAFMR